MIFKSKIVLIIILLTTIMYSQGNDSLSLRHRLEDSIYVNVLSPILHKAVPELAKWESEYQTLTQGKYKIVTYVRSLPDSTSISKIEQDYYMIYVAHEGQFAYNTFERYLIHKKTKEVFWYSLSQDSCFTLNEWRTKYKSQ